MNSYKKILNQIPPDYYEHGTRSNLFQWAWHSWKFWNLKKFINGIKGEVLDIGCADGYLTSKIAFELKHANVTGVDLYKKTIVFAQKKWPNVKFITADARKLPFKNSSFNAVICVETLEHVPSNFLVLEEIRRVLKKNGSLVVCQDTDSWIFNLVWSFWTKWKGKVWVGAHISCMKPSQLESFLEDNGFSIQKKSYSHGGMEVTFLAKKK